MKILIAGAGIGGLTAALCLEKAGYQVQVFEQSEELSEIGAGLQCGANALKVLDYLGLLNAVEPLAVAPLRADFRDQQSGEILYSIPFGSDYISKYGAPYYQLYRPDLHGVLCGTLLQRAPDSVILNASVSGYTESPDKVVVKLADGREFPGDCLIAADGIKSTIRYQLLGAKAPRFTGNVAWRCVLPTERLPSGFMPKIVSNFVGFKKHAVIYYLRNQQLINFVGVVENRQWRDDSWVTKAPWQELKAEFNGWHPIVQSVIDRVDKDQCYRWALYDHKQFSNWSSGRVTLLGDAAHSTLPFIASGAAMAIEDARILERALSQTSNVSDGLQLYQNNRFARTAKIQSVSRNMGRLYHLKNKYLLKMAFQGLKLLPGRAEAFLPDYDANTVTLS